MAKETRIVVADDHPIFLRGLVQVIEKKPDFAVIGEATDGQQALETILELEPDLAVLDISMPGKDGFQIVEELNQQKALHIKIVFLTMFREEAYLEKALDLGAMGYVLKENAVSEVQQCLLTVAKGQVYVSPILAGYFVEQKKRREALWQQTPGLLALTPTEYKILRLIAQNKTSREIAETLFVSIRTIQNHRNNICKKLQLQGYNKLFEFALRHKTEI